MKLNEKMIHLANRIKAKYAFSSKHILGKDDVIYAINVGSFFTDKGNNFIVLNEFITRELTIRFKELITIQQKLLELELEDLGNMEESEDFDTLEATLTMLLGKEPWELEEDNFIKQVDLDLLKKQNDGKYP